MKFGKKTFFFFRGLIYLHVPKTVKNALGPANTSANVARKDTQQHIVTEKKKKKSSLIPMTTTCTHIEIW